MQSHAFEFLVAVTHNIQSCNSNFVQAVKPLFIMFLLLLFEVALAFVLMNIIMAVLIIILLSARRIDNEVEQQLLAQIAFDLLRALCPCLL